MASRDTVMALLEQHKELTYAALIELAYLQQGHGRIGRTVRALERKGTIVRRRRTAGRNKLRDRILLAQLEIPVPSAVLPSEPVVRSAGYPGVTIQVSTPVVPWGHLAH